MGTRPAQKLLAVSVMNGSLWSNPQVNRPIGNVDQPFTGTDDGIAVKRTHHLIDDSIFGQKHQFTLRVRWCFFLNPKLNHPGSSTSIAYTTGQASPIYL